MRIKTYVALNVLKELVVTINAMECLVSVRTVIFILKILRSDLLWQIEKYMEELSK